MQYQSTSNFDKNMEREYDPSARPPMFKHRSPFYKSSGSLIPSDMRLILIEAESRVLFDSATVIPVKNGSHPAARTLSACGEFQFLRRKKDTVKLSQMIFGGVPSLKTSESFRIHVLEDEEQILVSKTFSIPKQSKFGADHNSSDSDSQNTVKSLDGWRTRASKSIMTTPEGFNRVRHISITFGDEDNDSHFGSSSSTMSLPRAFSPPHRISKARRRQLAATTSLSETSSVPIPSGLKARSRMSSISSSQNDEDHHLLSLQSLRNVALGILMPTRQRFFLMQHIPLIESEMARFETRIITAAGHPPTFLRNIAKCWEELTAIICQLHNAPRLKHPYWLALNEKCHLDEKTLASEFCEQLAFLVRKYDRKEAGYFLSNLVTALLMHHMSWVASVASPPLVNADNRHKNAMLFGMTAKEGAPTIGYNASMAQYLEISGACGNMRSAKLCILGDDVEVLASVCSVLTFFIRCSAVQHIDNDIMWEVPTEQSFSPVNVSNSPISYPESTSCRNGCTLINSGDPFKFDETSSVAMMRRLRNNSQTTATTPIHASCEIVEKTAQSASNGHESMTFIDRIDFPCCPTISSTDEMWISGPISEGLGRSMFAGPLNQYCSHFVISALLKSEANLPDAYSRMFDEVRCNDSPCHRSVTIPSSSQSSSSLCDAGVPENVLIVADIDEMNVKVLSSEGSDEVTSPSESVVAMLEQFVGIHDAVPATAEFLVGVIEDSLAHIVGKSLTLVELVRSDQTKQPASLQLTPDRVRTIIGNLTSIGVLAQIIEYNTSKLGSKMFQAKSKKPARTLAWLITAKGAPFMNSPRVPPAFPTNLR
ncbi:unnamed protein product [Caenorhabditis sp. 36 PRJEB53466]|nr:unnamed protein product [Caenorhabditis sp. 36 PRJEB53466]